ERVGPNLRVSRGDKGSRPELHGARPDARGQELVQPTAGKAVQLGELGDGHEDTPAVFLSLWLPRDNFPAERCVVRAKNCEKILARPARAGQRGRLFRANAGT